MNNRHAYLIMAHGHFNQVIRLIGMLDDERNDFYIHVDAKNRDFEPAVFDGMNLRGRLFLTDRVKVYWGSLSIVKAVYLLLKKSSGNGEYRYYHLLSGSDLPLKDQSYIHDFLDNCDREFISFFNRPFEDRSKYYWLYDDDYLAKNPIKRRIRTAFFKLQKRFLTDRNNKNAFRILPGPAWFSITDDLVRFVISKEEFVLRRWKWTKWPDESFMQTLVLDSVFSDRLYDPDGSEYEKRSQALRILENPDDQKDLLSPREDDYKGCMRMIDWKRGNDIGNPYVWRERDYDDLMASGCLFARKFDPAVDPVIIDMIEAFVRSGREKQA